MFREDTEKKEEENEEETTEEEIEIEENVEAQWGLYNGQILNTQGQQIGVGQYIGGVNQDIPPPNNHNKLDHCFIEACLWLYTKGTANSWEQLKQIYDATKHLNNDLIQLNIRQDVILQEKLTTPKVNIGRPGGVLLEGGEHALAARKIDDDTAWIFDPDEGYVVEVKRQAGRPETIDEVVIVAIENAYQKNNSEEEPPTIAEVSTYSEKFGELYTIAEQELITKQKETKDPYKIYAVSGSNEGVRLVVLSERIVEKIEVKTKEEPRVKLRMIYDNLTRWINESELKETAKQEYQKELQSKFISQIKDVKGKGSQWIGGSPERILLAEMINFGIVAKIRSYGP